MKFAERTYKIKQSLTRKLFDLAKSYDDVVDLTLGDPDLSPCNEIKLAACDSIIKGDTHYSSNAGLYEARKAIADFSSARYSINIDASNVLISVGGMESLFLLLYSLLDKDDEVVMFSPCYVNYVQMTLLCDAKPIVIPFADNDFNIDFDKLNDCITDRTKVIIINNPCNPTGKVLSVDILRRISEIAIKNDLFVISDEVYSSLVYEKPFCSICQLNGMKDRLAIVDSMSKRYSMTGYRLGYSICNEELINCMTKVQENVVACAPLQSQYAAIEAYGKTISNEYVKSEFMKRRDYVIERIRQNKMLKISSIDSAFYAFVDISKSNMKSLDFSMKLLKTNHVAVVPGITYGDDCDAYVRIAFTKNVDILRNAFDKIDDFTDRLMKGDLDD